MGAFSRHPGLAVEFERVGGRVDRECCESFRLAPGENPRSSSRRKPGSSVFARCLATSSLGLSLKEELDPGFRRDDEQKNKDAQKK
jgi:hypothetical protein